MSENLNITGRLDSLRNSRDQLNAGAKTKFAPTVPVRRKRAEVPQSQDSTLVAEASSSKYQGRKELPGESTVNDIGSAYKSATIVKEEPDLSHYQVEDISLPPQPLIDSKLNIKEEPSTKNLFTNNSNQDIANTPLLFFQFPTPLPNSLAKDSTSISNFPEGKVGKLNVHQSGKLSMTIGDISFTVNEGTSSSFLRYLSSINETNRQFHNLGRINHRFICTPDIDSILSKDTSDTFMSE